jgi:hypothetical protein
MPRSGLTLTSDTFPTGLRRYNTRATSRSIHCAQAHCLGTSTLALLVGTQLSLQLPSAKAQQSQDLPK